MFVVCVFPIKGNINQVFRLTVTTHQIKAWKELKLGAPEAYLEPTRTSTMELFHEYS